MLFPYLPHPVTDELLYSWLARSAALNQLGSVRDRIGTLFGHRSNTPSVDIPIGLDALQRSLGGQSPWTDAMEILLRTTLYPYYRPFVGTREPQIVRSFLLGPGQAVRTFMGHVASRFGVTPALKFCDRCLREDWRTEGVGVWRRSHHLPGVLVCARHSKALRLLGGTERCDHSRQELVLPPAQPELTPIACEPGQQQFARLSVELLTSELTPLEPTRVINTHLESLASRDLVHGHATRRRANYDRLVRHILAFYDGFDSFQHRERLVATERTPLAWLRGLLERPEKLSHPVCHLVLIGFLYGSVKQFAEQYASSVSPRLRGRRALPVPKRPSIKERGDRRGLWMAALNAMPGTAAKAVRALEPAAYAWLYRNDRSWLLRICRRSRKARSPSMRVNWSERDRELCSRARAFAEMFASHHPRTRLSLSRLRKALGETMIRQNGERLPRLNQLLAELSVSVTRHQENRIEMALAEMCSECSKLTWSAIQRRAGIKKWTDELRRFTGARAAGVPWDL